MTTGLDRDGPARQLTGSNSKWRVLAVGVDSLLATIAALLLGRAVSEISTTAAWGIVFAVYFAYFAVSEGLWSRTPGKALFGLRVVRTNGEPCGWSSAIIRTVLRVFEANPLFLGILPGGFVVALTERSQRLGDLLAKTLVVEVERDSEELD